MPFLDRGCISEQYIRQAGSIFEHIHRQTNPKRYNDLVLNGTLLLKILNEIQRIINSHSPNHHLSLESLYRELVEDLYLSGYNYCILAYHQAMERQLEDEKPKSLEEMIEILEQVGDEVLEQFKDFNLDADLHAHYLNKLHTHIDEKEVMLLEVNRNKTEQAILKLYTP